MLRKLLLLVLILFSPTVFAQTTDYKSAVQNSRPYKALAQTTTKAYTAIKLGTPYVGGAIGNQNTQGYNGLYLQGFGGWAMRSASDTYYLAGEIWANTGSLPLSQNYYRRTMYGLGVTIIPGIILKHYSLVYARIGTGTFRYNKNLSYFTGGQLGIGLQSNITGNWDLRGEYIYTGKAIFEGFGDVRFNLFNLGLVYKIS